jgi:hypothetical protein
MCKRHSQDNFHQEDTWGDLFVVWIKWPFCVNLTASLIPYNTQYPTRFMERKAFEVYPNHSSHMVSQSFI